VNRIVSLVDSKFSNWIDANSFELEFIRINDQEANLLAKFFPTATVNAEMFLYCGMKRMPELGCFDTRMLGMLLERL
jgi:hypothetical protein